LRVTISRVRVTKSWPRVTKDAAAAAMARPFLSRDGVFRAARAGFIEPAEARSGAGIDKFSWD